MIRVCVHSIYIYTICTMLFLCLNAFNAFNQNHSYCLHLPLCPFVWVWSYARTEEVSQINTIPFQFSCVCLLRHQLLLLTVCCFSITSTLHCNDSISALARLHLSSPPSPNLNSNDSLFSLDYSRHVQWKNENRRILSFLFIRSNGMPQLILPSSWMTERFFPILHN